MFSSDLILLLPLGAGKEDEGDVDENDDDDDEVDPIATCAVACFVISTSFVLSIDDVTVAVVVVGDVVVIAGCVIVSDAVDDACEFLSSPLFVVSSADCDAESISIDFEMIVSVKQEREKSNIWNCMFCIL